MKEDIKLLWVRALESGDYLQGRGALRRRYESGDRYCCLGVLCDLAVKAGIISAPVPPNETGYKYVYENGRITAGLCNEYAYENGRTTVLGPVVMEWAGLDNEYGEYGDEGESSLIGLNDGPQEASFLEIAQVIRRHF